MTEIERVLTTLTAAAVNCAAVGEVNRSPLRHPSFVDACPPSLSTRRGTDLG